MSVARDDLSSIRTGRANPGMFSRIIIDYYGSIDPDHAAVAASTCPRPGWSSSSRTRQSQLQADRGRHPQLRPRREPVQRRQRHPGRHPAADRGASPRTGQAGQVQGRGRQGVGAQHPPQGDGGAAPHQEGRRGRRGRGQPREKDLDKTTHHTSTRSTNWSSTKKANCWRSDVAEQQAGSRDRQPVDEPPKKASRAGRNLPAAIGVGVAARRDGDRHPAVRADRLAAASWRSRSRSPPTRSSAGCARPATPFR